jgi:V/A-type H+-transporting ATPase subunit E
MSEQVQELIDRIRRDGVAVAAREAEAILADARRRAGEILASAEASAAALRASAEADARRERERGELALKQSARDLLLRVGHELEALVLELLEQRASEVLDPAIIEKLLLRFAEVFADRGGDPVPLDVWIGPAEQERLLAFCRGELRSALERGVEVHIDWRLQRGFDLRLKGGELRHEIRPRAIAEALGEVVRPELAAIVQRAALALGEARTAP